MNKIEEKIDVKFAIWNKKDIQANVGEVKKLCEDYTKNILKIKSADKSFENIVKYSDSFSKKISKIASGINLITMLHKDESLRAEAQKAEIEISKHCISVDSNHDIFLTVKEYTDNNFKKELAANILTAEEVYIVEEMVKGYKRSGMLLPKKERSRLEVLKKKISKLESDFNMDYMKYFSFGAYFNKEELVGVPESIINNFKTKTEKGIVKYFVTLSRGDKAAIAENCEVRETRKILSELALKGAGNKNTKRLNEALKIRYEYANILGYKNYTDYALENELVNSAKKLETFMKDLEKSLEVPLKSDFKKIENIKEKYGIKKIERYDRGYLESKYEKENLQIDSELVSEYFEYEQVLDSTWKILENIFDVKVEMLEGSNPFDKMARVYKWTDKKNKNILGHTLIDLFPRPGKYGHACVTGCDMNVDGSNFRSKALVSNFQIMIKENKYLLSYENVNTFLHEMGHLAHTMLDESSYSATSAFSTSNDFVEIPSQLMENFLAEEKTLNVFARHYKTGKKLDKKTTESILKKSKLFSAMGWNIISVQALTDIEIHSKNSKKYIGEGGVGKMNKVYENIYNKKMNGIKMFKEQNFLSSFGHLMGGYESKYYSYIASFVYMCDVWESLNKKGIANMNTESKKAGMKYRKEFLSLGSKLPEHKILKDFLGREASTESFLKFLKD